MFYFKVKIAVSLVVSGKTSTFTMLYIQYRKK